jgi:hypothetical protein
MRALAILCMTAGIAHAGSNEISFIETARGLPSSSAQALTDKSMTGGGPAYARRLGTVADQSDLELWVGGGLEGGTSSGTLFQSMSTDIDTVSVFGFARVRYPLVSSVAASARVGLGSSRVAVDLHDGAGHTLSDSGWSALAAGAAGLEFSVRPATRMAFGLRVELGYTRVTGAAIAPASDSSGGTLRLQMSQNSFGHLDLSGPFLSFSLITSF